MTEDVFSSNVTESKPDETPVMLDQLVGEDKKYKTVEDLAKSRLEADQFIDKLKGETSEMREALAELQAKNEEYERILKAGREGEDDATPTGQVKPEEIAALVDQAVQAREAQQSTERNIRESQEALVEKLGSIEDARAFVAKRAGELGVTVEYLQSQAATSPSVFAALMGVAKPAAPAQSSAASIPASSTASSGGIQYGTKEYFSEMRRSNPSQYFSPKVQNEMFNLVKEGKLKL